MSRGNLFSFSKRRTHQIWDILTRPAPHLSAIEQVQSRFILTVIVFGLILYSVLTALQLLLNGFDIGQILVAAITNGVLILTYYIGRIGRVQAAGMLLIFGTTQAVYVSMFAVEAAPIVTPIVYLVLPVFLGTMLFRTRIVIGLGMANIAVLILLELAIPDFKLFEGVFDSFTYYVVSLIVIMILTWYVMNMSVYGSGI